MSITKDTLQKHLTDPAVFCCRRAKGTVIGADDLEDPTLFDDMVDAGLLTLSDDGLTIEEVLGSTLQKDVEALTPITKDVLIKSILSRLSLLKRYRPQLRPKQLLRKPHRPGRFI